MAQEVRTVHLNWKDVISAIKDKYGNGEIEYQDSFVPPADKDKQSIISITSKSKNPLLRSKFRDDDDCDDDEDGIEVGTILKRLVKRKDAIYVVTEFRNCHYKLEGVDRHTLKIHEDDLLEEIRNGEYQVRGNAPDPQTWLNSMRGEDGVEDDDCDDDDSDEFDIAEGLILNDKQEDWIITEIVGTVLVVENASGKSRSYEVAEIEKEIREQKLIPVATHSDPEDWLYEQRYSKRKKEGKTNKQTEESDFEEDEEDYRFVLVDLDEGAVAFLHNRKFKNVIWDDTRLNSQEESFIKRIMQRRYSL